MKVSVIIPAYNSSALLERAIESVLKQTHLDWEMIVVDDGSTDDTRKIAESYAAKDKRIRYFFEDNSGGPARPINLGIRNAHGDFVAFLEQDDEWMPEKLEKQLAFFEVKDGPVIVGCEAVAVNDVSGKRKKVVIEERADPKLWFRAMIENDGFFFNLSTLLVRKDALGHDISFDENLKVVADFDLYIRTMPQGFAVVHEPLVVYHSNMESLSKRKDSTCLIIDDMEYIMEKHKEIFTSFPKARAKLAGYIGILSYCVGRRERARRYFRESFAGHMFNPKLIFKVLLLYLLGGRTYLSIRNAYFEHINIR